MPIFQLNFEDGDYGFVDTDNSSLYTKDLIRFELPLCNSKKKIKDTNDAWVDGALVKNNTPSFVRIVMGFNCNFKCKYCSQSYADKHKKTSVEEAVTFAIKFCETIKGDPGVIEFWGGEPLMYFKHLKAMLPIFRNRFPNTRFATVTNGSLITREILEFLWEYRISCAISHDGIGQYVRGEDFLLNEKKRSLWLELWRRYEEAPVNKNTPRVGVGFVVTMNATNPDISKNVRYIRDHFCEGVQVMGSCCTTLGEVNTLEGYREVAFTPETLDQMEKGVYKNLVDDNPRTQCAEIYDNKRDLINDYSHHYNYYGLTRCGADAKDRLFLKIDGTILYCQNYDVQNKEHGTIWDLDHVRIHGITKMYDRESCTHCPWIHICRGGCPSAKGKNFAELCTIYSAMFRPIFKNFIENVYKKRLVSINGDFRVPDVKASTDQEVVYNKFNQINFGY